MNYSYDDKPVIFVVPGDLHLTEPGLDNHRVACRVVEEVNHLIRPDFVQFIGDNVQHAKAEEFRLFRDLVSELQCPHFALVGDHDRDKLTATEQFIKHVGDPYGSTRLSGFRFVRLNSQEFRPVGFSEDQLDWLEGEFGAASLANQRVVIFQHNYPFKVYEDYAGSGIDRWRMLMCERSPVAIICGHTHYGQIANDGRNVSIATRSIGDPEGGPPGCLLGFVQGDDLAIKYRTMDSEAAVALITHPRDALLTTSSRQIVSGPDAIRVRTWSHEPIAGVQWRLNGDPWCYLDRDSGNQWSAPLPVEGLSKGENQIEVTGIDQSGECVASDSVGFIFDLTGRYTPIPRVSPVVKQTSFC